jgi:hypothetical protein
MVASNLPDVDHRTINPTPGPSSAADARSQASVIKKLSTASVDIWAQAELTARITRFDDMGL